MERNKIMGRVTVELLVSNNRDVQMAEGGALPPERIRRFQVTATVDTAATGLVLPKDVSDRLGLPPEGEVIVHYADRRSVTRPKVGQAEVQLLGRRSTFDAVVEPDRTTALIGAVILETLDLLVDCKQEKLVPRDPEHITAELE